jgi:TrmH family RNA methyltransferase
VENARIVLVRPRNPLNIGAAARAMANFGLEDLAVVKPHAPVWRETVSAVGAEDLVLKAREAKSLQETIGDCDLVLGTTVVRERDLSRPVVRLPELGEFLAERRPRRLAVLFGNEKSGLTNLNLEKCHAYLTVPTSAKQPSMNLGHAVAVVCYELSRARLDLGAPARRMRPADADSLERSRPPTTCRSFRPPRLPSRSAGPSTTGRSRPWTCASSTASCAS